MFIRTDVTKDTWLSWVISQQRKEVNKGLQFISNTVCSFNKYNFEISKKKKKRKEKRKWEVTTLINDFNNNGNYVKNLRYR